MVITKPYNPEQIAMLKQTLVKEQQHRDTSREYEIRVDNMSAVPRTNDLELFDTYEDFITDETKAMEVIIYFGQSRRSNRYIYTLKEQKEANLSGVDVDKMLEDKIAQVKKQWDYDQLKKENQLLKEEKKEADDYIDTLQKIIDDLKSKRKLGDLQWGEIIGVAGESLLRRNSHLLAKVPGMAGLAGIIDEDNKNPKKEIESPKPEVEASFEMKKQSAEEISKEDKDRLDFLRQLQERFSKEELSQVLDLMNLLVGKPKAIEPTFIYAFQWKETSAELKPEPKTESAEEEKKGEPESEIQEKAKQEVKENTKTESEDSQEEEAENLSY